MVEQRVWEAVLDIVRDPAVIEKAADLRVSAQDIAAEHRQAVDRLAKVESAWRKLWNAYEDEVIDEATFNREAQAIRNRRNTATRDRDAAAQLLADAGNAEQRRRAVVSKLEEIAKRNLSGLPFKERKRLVGQLFDSILVDTNSRTVEFRGPVTGMISLDSPVPSSVPRLSARFSGP